MELFYDDQLEASDSFLEIVDAEAKHINRVLRKSIGDELHLTNGKGLLVRGVIIVSTKVSVSLKLVDAQQLVKPEPKIHLWFGMMHTADRLEFALEKVTELGVSSINLVKTMHSQPSGIIKKNRLDQKVVGALKQSHGVFRPDLNFYENIDAALKNISLSDHVLGLVAHEVDFENRKRKNLIELVDNFPQKQKEVHLFIGAEGGFNNKEVSAMLLSGCSTVSLGSKRLRAETAAILGIGILTAKLHN
jgi:16S rRNA (uracil1498-N3)-methyltransferase